MKINNVVIVSKGTVNNKPVFPNKKLSALFGTVFGLFIGIFVILIRLAFDKTVKNSKYLTDDLGIINLGQVYHVDKGERVFQVVDIISNNNLDTKDKLKRRRV